VRAPAPAALPRSPAPRGWSRGPPAAHMTARGSQPALPRRRAGARSCRAPAAAAWRARTPPRRRGCPARPGRSPRTPPRPRRPRPLRRGPGPAHTATRRRRTAAPAGQRPAAPAGSCPPRPARSASPSPLAAPPSPARRGPQAIPHAAKRQHPALAAPPCPSPSRRPARQWNEVMISSRSPRQASSHGPLILSCYPGGGHGS